MYTSFDLVTASQIDFSSISSCKSRNKIIHIQNVEIKTIDNVL